MAGKLAAAKALGWKGAKDLESHLVPIASVQLHARNARKRTRRNLEAIRASLTQFGQQRAIVTFQFAGDKLPSVIAGNGGLQVARELGWSHVAVTRFQGTAEEAEAYAIADNRSAELSTWDRTVLDAQATSMRARANMADLYRKLSLDALQPSRRADEPVRGELLTFTLSGASASGRTQVWDVVAQDKSPLGLVKWFSRWRRYVFHPKVGTLFDHASLREIADYCERVTGAKRGAAAVKLVKS